METNQAFTCVGVSSSRMRSVTQVEDGGEFPLPVVLLPLCIRIITFPKLPFRERAFYFYNRFCVLKLTPVQSIFEIRLEMESRETLRETLN